MGNTVAETKALKVKVAVNDAGEERTITAVVSSSNLDRDYEFVDVPSLRLPLKGGGHVVASQLTGTEPIDIPMLLNHSFDVEDVIGSVRKAYLNESNELVVEFGISGRAKAQDLMTLIDEKHLDNAFSITMNDYTYEDNTLFDAEIVEISLVFRGSNKDARVLAVKSLIKESEMADAKKQTIAELEAENERLSKELEEATAETVEEEVEVTEEDEATEEEVAGEASEESVEEAEVEEVTEPETKSVKKETKMSKEIAVKQVKDTPVVEAEAIESKTIDKVDFAAKQFVAWVNKDHKTLTELNQQAIDSYSSKETFLNAGVTADGGAIVPEAQLLTDIYSTLGEFSTVANDLRVITLATGDSLDVATLVADVVVSEVDEEGDAKDVTKPVFGDDNVALREFAGIAIITKKLVRQAAVNVYDILRESFARAIANQRAILALTDANSGIANKVGVATVESTGWGVGSATYQDIKRMAYAVPATAVSGGKYYISRQLLEVLDTATDEEGRELDILTLDGNGLSGRFKNGFPFAVEEVLGDATTHAVFGAMGRYGILLRQGAVEGETFDTGTVTDGSEVEHNLLQENKLAHRVAFYENVGYPLPGAFAILVDEVS